MPLYDFRCLAGCGYFNDIIVSIEDRTKVRCPTCNGAMRTVVSAVALIGPMPSKPLVVNQVGRTFHSNAEWNEYQRSNPGCEIVSASSSAWREHKDKARSKAESKAKSQGYRDLEDKQKKNKAAKLERSSVIV